MIGLGQNDALYALRWDGHNRLNKWKIVYKGRAVKIRSTIHQMGITERYVIFAETAFKLGVGSLIPARNTKSQKPIKSWYQELSLQKIFGLTFDWMRFHRKDLTFPQLPNTTFYIIPRTELARVKPGGSVESKRFTIEGECNHFLVEYKNSNDKITIYAALNKASDAAEFIHGDDDSSPFPNTIRSGFAGIFSNGMAVNRPAIYVIDGKTGVKEKEELLDFEESKTYTWSLGLCTYRDDLPTPEFTDIYWLGFGAWKNIQTQLVYDLYKKYPYRDSRMTLAQVMEQIEQGVPTILSRLHIDQSAKPMLSIADSYRIPGNYFANSPQFVPRKNSKGATDGYIICSAINSDNLISYLGDESGENPGWSDNSELWVFDAKNLSQGPLCRLSHPKLNFSFTLHTAWLPNRAPSPTRAYDVREDFHRLVEEASKRYSQKVGKQMRDLFEQVYREFESDRKSV
ncbi:carotenoid oxygenase family protein [Microseira wollei]|uniref:Dioxygenase n=1 Tax=Microseira wollei NIES-4236 TaxID=2530354 RepID=A0AAV3XH35_9CYAN|nr:carotenoid oxygenase family protein [Microseira wollei]GET39727.1 hypothetical protein MiSe_44990 [Microseira wollei NIES-4236]